MPKTLTPTIREATPYKQNLNSLKRNQACHQCRKRKLKCDAQRPCSTCLRSHAYALSHAPPAERANLPPRPECSYDEVSNASPPEQLPPAPKTRYEKLESRINELEALLRDKPGHSTGTSSSGSDRSPQSTNASSVNDFGVLPTLDGSATTAPSPSSSILQSDWTNMYFNGQQSSPSLHSQSIAQLGNGNPLEGLAGIASMMQDSPIQTAHITSIPSPPSENARNENFAPSPSVNPDLMSAPSPMSDMDHSLLFLSWPSNLPDPATTRHLVQAFFSHCVHATRLFHAPSFFASLNLMPSDPGFPPRSILHIMCAIGSMYTSSFPTGFVIEAYPVDPATRTRRGVKQRPQSFASEHARFAKEALEEDLECGERMFESGQARVLLTWWYYSQARWIDSCLSSATAMRSCVTMALNVCPPFQGLSVQDTGSDRPPSILTPAKSVIEDEMRRNTFWLAYTMDRQSGAGNGWAMNIDDLDIHQLLPLRQDQWERGVLLLPPERQYSHDKDTLSVYPPEQTDPFIMYCKATMLMSRVKNFCLRYRSLRFVGDSSVSLPDGLADMVSTQNPLTIRDTPAFVELTRIIQTMKTSFPASMKGVINEGKLDVYTYCTWNLIHLAQIHLHEPFAHPGSQSCTSALAILTASRAIIDSLHVVTSTSFDVSLLDTIAFLCWYMAGRILTRFLKAAQDNRAVEQLVPLKTEISFIRSMLLRAGERIPLAYCYWKMLVGVIQQTGVEVEEQEMYFPHLSPPIAPQFQFAMDMKQSGSVPGVPVPS